MLIRRCLQHSRDHLSSRARLPACSVCVVGAGRPSLVQCVLRLAPGATTSTASGVPACAKNIAQPNNTVRRAAASQRTLSSWESMAAAAGASSAGTAGKTLPKGLKVVGCGTGEPPIPMTQSWGQQTSDSPPAGSLPPVPQALACAWQTEGTTQALWHVRGGVIVGSYATRRVGAHTLQGKMGASVAPTRIDAGRQAAHEARAPRSATDVASTDLPAS